MISPKMRMKTWGAPHGTRYIRHERGRREAPRGELSTPLGRAALRLGTYSTQEPGTRGPCVQCGGLGAYVSTQMKTVEMMPPSTPDVIDAVRIASCALTKVLPSSSVHLGCSTRASIGVPRWGATVGVPRAARPGLRCVRYARGWDAFAARTVAPHPSPRGGSCPAPLVRTACRCRRWLVRVTRMYGTAAAHCVHVNTGVHSSWLPFLRIGRMRSA